MNKLLFIRNTAHWALKYADNNIQTLKVVNLKATWATFHPKSRKCLLIFQEVELFRPKLKSVLHFLIFKDGKAQKAIKNYVSGNGTFWTQD